MHHTTLFNNIRTLHCTTSYIVFRNPDPKMRPQFGQIAEVLAGDRECLLGWSDEDKQFGGENAMKLGASLENGNNLYFDLQMQYRQ